LIFPLKTKRLGFSPGDRTAQKSQYRTVLWLPGPSVGMRTGFGSPSACRGFATPCFMEWRFDFPFYPSRPRPTRRFARSTSSTGRQAVLDRPDLVWDHRMRCPFMLKGRDPKEATSSMEDIRIRRKRKAKNKLAMRRAAGVRHSRVFWRAVRQPVRLGTRSCTASLDGRLALSLSWP
jgi:hypothetical protein